MVIRCSTSVFTPQLLLGNGDDPYSARRSDELDRCNDDGEDDMRDYSYYLTCRRDLLGEVNF